MLIGETTQFEYKHFIIINDLPRNIFYYFDYDVRESTSHMEFQHYHAFYEMLILLEKDADHLIEGNPYHIQMNDLVLLAPSVLHKSVYPEGITSKRIVISFMIPDVEARNPDLYEKLLSPFHTEVPIYRFETEDRRRLFGILNEILNFSKQKSFSGSELDNFYIHTKFQEFLYALYSLQTKNTYQDEYSMNSMERKVYDIATYIHNHYQEDLSLESLAKAFFISPSYLSHQFKDITSFSLLNYIQMTRIKQVQYKLVSSGDKISDIAVSCGFTSFSQFNRIFNKIVGTSPSDYRKNGSLGH